MEKAEREKRYSVPRGNNKARSLQPKSAYKIKEGKHNKASEATEGSEAKPKMANERNGDGKSKARRRNQRKGKIKEGEQQKYEGLKEQVERLVNEKHS
jgi:hypothetical protein